MADAVADALLAFSEDKSKDPTKREEARSRYEKRVKTHPEPGVKTSGEIKDAIDRAAAEGEFKETQDKASERISRERTGEAGVLNERMMAEAGGRRPAGAPAPSMVGPDESIDFLASRGDKEAQKSKAGSERARQATAVASTWPLGVLGGPIIGGVRGGAAAGGADEALKGKRGKDILTSALSGGVLGGVLGGLTKTLPAFSRSRVNALKADKDIGPMLARAREGGYETSFKEGMKVADDSTAHPLGKEVVKDRAQVMASDDVLPSIQTQDKAVTEMGSNVTPNPQPVEGAIEKYVAKLKEFVNKQKSGFDEAGEYIFQADSPGPSLVKEIENMERIVAGGMDDAHLETFIDNLQKAGKAKQYAGTPLASMKLELADDLAQLRRPEVASAVGKHKSEIERIKNIKRMTGVTSERIPGADGKAETIMDIPEAKVSGGGVDSATIRRMKGELGRANQDTILRDNLLELAKGKGPLTEKKVRDLIATLDAEALRGGGAPVGGTVSDKGKPRLWMRDVIKPSIHTDPIFRQLARVGEAGEKAARPATTASGTQVPEDVKRALQMFIWGLPPGAEREQ